MQRAEESTKTTWINRAWLQHLQPFLWLKRLCEAMGGSIFYFSHTVHLTDQWRMERHARRHRLQRFYFQSALVGWETGLWIIANIVKISGASQEGRMGGESICGKGWRITTTGSCLGSMCTCIYNACAHCFNYSRFHAAPGPGWLEPYVNIYSAPGCDICSRLPSETVEMSHRSWRTEDIRSWRADSVCTERVALVVPRTEWWSRRSALVLSTSGWSSPHKRCPETTPAALHQALQETRNRSQRPKVSSCFVNVYSNEMLSRRGF